MLPQIKIDFAWLLEPLLRSHYESRKQHRDFVYPTQDEALEKVALYKKVWTAKEQDTLRGMMNVLDLEFAENIIHVYLVPYLDHSISSPLIIHLRFDPDRFLDELTHELLHRLLTENNRNLDVKKIWLEMFPEEKLKVRNHIVLHAVHEHIFRNIFNDPSRLEKEITRVTGEDYKRSWQIVIAKGYKNIIEKFKTFYDRREYQKIENSG